MLSYVVTPALRKGRRAFVPADLDAPHTWTCTEDVAALLVTGVYDERAWGRAWHVPSNDPLSIRRADRDRGGAARRDARSSRPCPTPCCGPPVSFNPMAKELRETQHQFRRPFVLDSTAAQETFGLAPTPIAEAVRIDLAAGAPTGVRA